ncbi:DUF6527 family protein [Splendidivirga corallicola]|uniref:DUF6527 family protein n=1 Tax=Splendidivirga corallicola TaxID=3051826 RepID=UPI003D29A303
MRFLRKLIKWWFVFFQTQRPDFKVTTTDEVPVHYRAGIVYIVGTPTEPWLLTFLCPCGCRAEIKLNLLAEEPPYWQFKIKYKKINIHPSINRIIGCKSHFWIASGRTVWHLNRAQTKNQK